MLAWGNQRYCLMVLLHLRRYHCTTTYVIRFMSATVASDNSITLLRHTMVIVITMVSWPLLKNMMRSDYDVEYVEYDGGCYARPRAARYRLRDTRLHCLFVDERASEIRHTTLIATHYWRE